MGRFELFMVLAGFGLFFLYLPDSCVLAANSTTLDISAPSSVDIDEEFSVTAAYKSNGTDICFATCRLSGGWFSGYIYMSGISGCEYSVTLYAPTYSGSQTLEVYCQELGYDSQSEYFNIDVDRLDSVLSVDAEPASPYPGDSVTVYAYYEDDYGSAIAGSCSARLMENGAVVDYTDMFQSGVDYYRGELVLPQRAGDYSVTVTCTSNEHDTATEGLYFEARKGESYLSLSYPEVVYYGQDLEIGADYTHTGSLILGTCTITLGSEQSQMGFTTEGYRGKISIPYEEGRQSIHVECSSDNYETRDKEIVVSPVKRPTGIIVSSPVKREFYPTYKIPVRIFYRDSLTEEGITDGRCFLEDSHQLRLEGGYYVTTVSNLGVGDHELSIICSEQFHQEAVEALALSIVKIPLTVKLVDTREEYSYGEEIKVKAMAVSEAGLEEDVTCSARVDLYEPVFNRLLNYSTFDMTEEDGVWLLDIEEPSPSRMMVTVTCSGALHEEATAWTEISTRQLSRETEREALLILSVVSVALLGLLFLIRRKLKIL